MTESLKSMFFMSFWVAFVLNTLHFLWPYRSYLWFSFMTPFKKAFNKYFLFLTNGLSFMQTNMATPLLEVFIIFKGKVNSMIWGMWYNICPNLVELGWNLLTSNLTVVGTVVMIISFGEAMGF